jgi:hypothetical protein
MEAVLTSLHFSGLVVADKECAGAFGCAAPGLS